MELRHGWLERQRGDISCLEVFLFLADVDFGWGGGSEKTRRWGKGVYVGESSPFRWHERIRGRTYAIRARARRWSEDGGGA